MAAIHGPKGTPKTGTACSLWDGPVDSYGYGLVSRGGRLVKAHRVAWEAKHGRLPRGILRNRCGERTCVNPAHWEALSRREMLDAQVAAGALFPFQKGPAHPKFVLSGAVRAEVCRLRSEGASLRAIARGLGISKTSVSRVLAAREYTVASGHLAEAQEC